jgi:hypothetical protein
MAEDLIDKVFNFFSGENEHLSDKEMLLRQILRDISQSKHTKFFRTRTEEADPSLAAYFYSIYKLIYPVRVFIRDTVKMTRLRQIVLEAFMDSTVIETAKRLSAESLAQRAKGVDPAALAIQIQKDITLVKAGFNQDSINKSDRCYNLVMALLQFVSFDYPSFFKKFDPAFEEGVLSSDLKFSPVKATAIGKDLGDFLAVSMALAPDGDWKVLLGLLKACTGQELVSADQFIGMLASLREIQQSKILDQIAQIGLRNPIWQCKPKIPNEHIGESWLALKTAEGEKFINRINTSQRNAQITTLVKEIFETGDLVRLANYTTTASEPLQKKELEEYCYAEGLNYLQVFLDDFVEKEIHELCDVLLIRGQWTNNAASKEMSEAIHQLGEIPSQINEFDEKMSDEGDDGSRLRAAMLRIDRDHTQRRYINSIVGGANEEALEIINDAGQNFIIIGKHLKVLIDDIQKKRPDLILNWRELNMVSKTPLAARMTEDYKKINYFIQLMKLCTQME